MESAQALLERVRSRATLKNFDRWSALIVLAVVAMIGRFIGLATSPPGFQVDEVVAGAQLVCLANTGVDAFGNSWPIVSIWPAQGVSAVFPAQYLYPGAAWVSVFGGSVGSIRALEVLISLTTVIATAGVARNFFGRRGFAWALLLGAFSPWAWTLGRVGFGISGNPSAASLMVGLWFITRGGFRRRPMVWELIGWGAAWGTCAMYGYARASLLLVGIVVLVVLLRRRLLGIWELLIAGVTAIIMFIPILVVIRDGEFFGRVDSVSIFNDQWRAANGATGTLDLLRVFLENVARHLSPEFLFVNGDANLRHSTQFVGQLGWLETLLVLALPVVVFMVVYHRTSIRIPKVYVALVLCGLAGGIITASITFDGVPHANRMIASQPFFVLGLTAVALVLVDRWPVVLPAAVGVVAIFSFAFIPNYFGEYTERSYTAFESQIRTEAEAARASGDMSGFTAKYQSWQPKQIVQYWVGQNDGSACPGSG